MKTLVLMRHAKSSWKDHRLKDKERPLLKRGRKNAVQMGEVILEQELVPQLLLCSSAERARQTAAIVTETIRYTAEILYMDHLFMAEADVILDALKLLPDSVERVMVIGHNPGLESVMQILSGKIEAMPTAALAYLSLPISSWKEISAEVEAELAGLWKPKDLE